MDVKEMQPTEMAGETPKEELEDNVNHPKHYTQGPIEIIDLIDMFELNFYEAQVVKYLFRYKYKNGAQDLKKAMWYLDRYIQNIDQSYTGGLKKL